MDTKVHSTTPAHTVTVEPEPTPQPPVYVLPPVTVVFATLAAARQEGLTLDTAILAALIATRHQVTAAEAVDLAMHEAFDERVKGAGDVRARLIEQARAAQDAEYADDGAVAGVR